MLGTVTKPSALLSLLLLGYSYCPVALADIVLDSLKEPVPVRIQAPLITNQTAIDAPLTLVFPDAIHWNGSVIPAGTQLQTSVLENKPAKRLGRPAHFTLAVTGIALPEQDLKSLEKPLKLTVGMNPYETRRSLAARQFFIGAASNLATLPLDFVPGVSTLAAYGIGSGLDVLLGAGQELQKDDAYDNRSAGRRVAVGAFRGATGIPTYVALAKKGNNLSYQPDELVMAALEKPLWKALLQPASSLAEANK